MISYVHPYYVRKIMKPSQNNTPDALFRASQQRVEELSQTIRNIYVWAHTSGSLSELDEFMQEACVSTPSEIATRSNMVKVWEEGHAKFTEEWASRRDTSTIISLSQMMYYSSLMVTADLMAAETVRGWLWKIAYTASLLLKEDFDVLSRALEEYTRATRKHPGMTLECDGPSDATRLFALVEEIGEVAACLTYDNDAETGHGSDLESEAIQVIALALAWATRYLDDEEE